MKRLLQTLGLCLALLPIAACQAGDSEAYQAGVHYEVLPQPVPTIDPESIEVTEVFWYGCDHCFDFEPKLKSWLADLSEDTVFNQVPAVWHPDMKLHARAFYTAKVLKVLDPMHEVIFEAMNVKKQELRSEAEIAKLFTANGVDEASFAKTFNSFGVAQSVRVGESRQRGYRITGTPELVVNGKYRISTRHVGSQEEMLQVATFLIEKERRAQ